MSTENLTAYLREHAAGAAAAIDLIEHLISSHADTADAEFFQQLRHNVEADKTALDEILGRFGAHESPVLNTVSRLTEKAARAKFLLAGSGHGDLGRLETLEMLSLGVEGKRSLWLALEAAALPPLQPVDLPALISRAVEQRGEIEKRRLLAAAKAFQVAS